jgi:hypothetical protein
MHASGRIETFFMIGLKNAISDLPDNIKSESSRTYSVKLFAIVNLIMPESYKLIVFTSRHRAAVIVCSL